MYKKAGLSLCLCLMAVVSNYLSASQGASHVPPPVQAKSAIQGSAAMADTGSRATCDGMKAHQPAQTEGEQPCSP